MGKMFFNILATFAEFEVDLLRMHPRSIAVAGREGRLKGRKLKLATKQQTELPAPKTGLIILPTRRLFNIS
jgi:DNA invertase Pin-like site-specific DNA recombinase